MRSFSVNEVKDMMLEFSDQFDKYENNIKTKKIKDLEFLELECFEFEMYKKHNLFGFRIDYTIVNEDIEYVTAGKSRIIQKQNDLLFTNLGDSVYNDKDKFYEKYFLENTITISPDRDKETLEEYANRCAVLIKEARDSYKKHDHIIDTYNKTMEIAEPYLEEQISKIENKKHLHIKSIDYILYPIIQCHECVDKLCLQLNIKIYIEIEALLCSIEKYYDSTYYDYPLSFPIEIELGKPRQIIEEIDKAILIIKDYSKACKTMSIIKNNLDNKKTQSFDENILKSRLEKKLAEVSGNVGNS